MILHAEASGKNRRVWHFQSTNPRVAAPPRWRSHRATRAAEGETAAAGLSGQRESSDGRRKTLVPLRHGFQRHPNTRRYTTRHFTMNTARSNRFHSESTFPKQAPIRIPSIRPHAAGTQMPQTPQGHHPGYTFCLAPQPKVIAPVPVVHLICVAL